MQGSSQANLDAGVHVNGEKAIDRTEAKAGQVATSARTKATNTTRAARRQASATRRAAREEVKSTSEKAAKATPSVSAEVNSETNVNTSTKVK